jgi:hypothetical protein
LFWITLGLLASVVERYRRPAAAAGGARQRLTPSEVA